MNRMVFWILTVLLSFALLGCLLLTAVQIATFDISIYENAYAKYNLYDTTELTRRDYVDLSRKILEYLNGKTDSIYNRAIIFGSEKYLFSQKELTHMMDVKALFTMGYRMRNLSFLALILLLVAIFHAGNRKKHYMGKALFRASLILFAASTVLLIIISTDFYNYFTVFHEIFFTNDLWLLNPETDLLINMFPLEFFNNMAVRIFMYFAVGILVTASIGYFVYKTADS
ncbi:MAG: hypothetical protein HPY66_3615 [Firmicutes bacterium]|nr:hypothetical protein [Bacillota bacterium]MDI6706731.1 TIGR01906 family membrane protein [Bacillota bacterium]